MKLPSPWLTGGALHTVFATTIQNAISECDVQALFNFRGVYALIR